MQRTAVNTVKYLHFIYNGGVQEGHVFLNIGIIFVKKILASSYSDLQFTPS